MTIDSHQHFWKYDAEKYPWIDDTMIDLRRDFLPSDLKKLFDKNDIDGCVAVQANQTLAETDFLLNLASKNDFIKGVVGWVDLRNGNVNETLEKYSANEKLKGWRHVVQSEADPNFLLQSDFMRGVSYLKKYDFTYDILVFPHQLGAVLEFVKRFPSQKFVIDHLAKPYIEDGFYDGWALLMKEIAKHENVYCKISGMLTEADNENWTARQLHPYLLLVLESFGPERTMYGSDWPVCLLAGTYEQAKNVVAEFISNLGARDQKRIMGENAKAFYRL